MAVGTDNNQDKNNSLELSAQTQQVDKSIYWGSKVELHR